MEQVKWSDEFSRWLLLDVDADRTFEEITKLAAHICGTPTAAVSFVDAERVWHKSSVDIQFQETPRQDAFCSHAILHKGVLVVNDAAADPRFANHPLVINHPKLRFYAGAPLISSAGNAIGALCAWDNSPHEVNHETKNALENLAGQLIRYLESRGQVVELKRTISRMNEEDALLKEQMKQVHNYSRDLQVHAVRLEAINSRLEATAKLDGMTGLKNHRAFQERLEAEFQRALRYSIPLSLMLVDVDLFKEFNDTYGHLAGDDVLKTVAQVLQDCARGVDFVARYGGEEFVVILPHTEENSALAIGERLRAAIEGVNWPLRIVTASLGLATLTSSITDVRDLIAFADKALYYSKKTGRNCVTHTKDMPLPTSWSSIG